MNRIFVFFTSKKFLFFFLCASFQFLGLSGVPLNKAGRGVIGGETIVHLVSQSHGYWLGKKEKKKEMLTMLLIGFFLSG